jgi:hypothetical protein
MTITPVLVALKSLCPFGCCIWGMLSWIVTANTTLRTKSASVIEIVMAMVFDCVVDRIADAPRQGAASINRPSSPPSTNAKI